MEPLSSDVIQGNESDMLQFLFNFKERLKIGQENWICWSFLEVFRLHPLCYALVFYQLKGVLFELYTPQNEV